MKTVTKFGTKAQNLLFLKDKLDKVNVCEIYTFLVNDWLENKQKIAVKIKRIFKDSCIIVRSNSPLEDNLNSSGAGVYTSVKDVNPRSLEEIIGAVDTVIKSYIDRNPTSDYKTYEILVQNMLRRVFKSGVLLTRDLSGRPYYTLNFDQVTGQTDSVTSGTGRFLDSVAIIDQKEDIERLPLEYKRIIKASKQIEGIFDSPLLDIEWAIDENNDLYIFQVRPLLVSDTKHKDEIYSAVDKLRKTIKKRIFKTEKDIFGKQTLFSDMTDWNPAEIIGINPSPMAFTLYSYIITDEVWREGRGLMGYYNPKEMKLMCNFAGHPYIDVRRDFNSYLPNQLNHEVKHKLVNFFIDQLKKKPELHDKVEFTIVLSCFTFDFEQKKLHLKEYGFSEQEIEKIREILISLTNDIINDKHLIFKEMDKRISLLKRNLEHIKSQKINTKEIPRRIKEILDYCKTNGTIPFTVYARGAFIGAAMLKSLRKINILSESEFNKYQISMDTTVADFLSDMEQLRKNKIGLNEFIDKYGHLRPGTYDITMPTYKESLYKLIPTSSTVHSQHKIPTKNKQGLQLDVNTKQNINHVLRDNNLSFGENELFKFIKNSTYMREYVKFEFTKYLSYVLDLVNELGNRLGIEDKDLAYLTIKDIWNISFIDCEVNTIKNRLVKKIENNKHISQIYAGIRLPDFIEGEYDLALLKSRLSKPNFITNQRTFSHTFNLNEFKIDSQYSLENKIILIENADPGYDWIFAHNISGLITKYGGAASHMAIRCAEFNIPAAIGCGEQIFNNIKNRNKLLLDCKNNFIEPIKTTI